MIASGVVPQDYDPKHGGTSYKRAQSQSSTSGITTSNCSDDARWLGTERRSDTRRIVQYYQTNETGQPISDELPRSRGDNRSRKDGVIAVMHLLREQQA
jgi:hypothetical protein